jgi:DNA-binding CsgD family transcriptional regulator
MYLSSEDLQKFSSALEGLYGLASTHAVQQRMMQITAQLVDNSWVTYNEVAPFGSGRGITLSNLELSSDQARLYPVLHALWHQHPAVSAIGKASGALTFSDCMPRSQLEQLPLYNEYYRNVGTHDQLVLILPAGAGAMVRTLSINRADGEFTKRDRQIMNLLAPHFERACRNATLLDQINGPRAVVAIRSDGRIEFTSGNAGHWLRTAFGVTCLDGAQAPGRVLQWLAAQQTGADCYFERLTVPLADGTLSLRVGSRTEERTIILVEKIESTGQRHWSRLTPREREVLTWVARGKTNPEIAIILGMRPRTVEKHMENILDKLQLENRAGAMLAAIEHGLMPDGERRFDTGGNT